MTPPKKTKPTDQDLNVLDHWVRMHDAAGNCPTFRQVGDAVERAPNAIQMSLEFLDAYGHTAAPVPRKLTPKGKAALTRWRKRTAERAGG